MTWTCIFCGELLSMIARQFGPIDEPWCEACDADRNLHPSGYPVVPGIYLPFDGQGGPT